MTSSAETGPDSLPPRAPDRARAARIFREEALAAGFSGVGFARAETPPGFDRFARWIADGHHAGMAYLEETASVRASPEAILPGARSIVCLSVSHASQASTAADGSRIARYAAGDDYHGTLRNRAIAVAESVERRLGSGFAWRVCVDSTPIAERAFAAAAGLGWIGKNGCLIDPERGSFLSLAEIVTDLDLPADDPIAERCGSCVRCLDACPTDAFVSPGILDAHRCIAYWTIEHRGALPDDVKAALGHRVFGCDDCQDACPWNAPFPPSDRPVPSRAEWLAMGKGEWRRNWGATALNRAGRRGLQRNAAASVGSTAESGAAASLGAVRGVSDPGVADAAAWAIRRIGPEASPVRKD